MQAIRIRKGDQVRVITGREKGKTGQVIRVSPSDGKVFVEKVNIIKRHMKPTAKNRQGGILEREAGIPVSNLMVVCPKCHEAVRVGYKGDGAEKMRVCKACGEVVDLKK